MIKTIMVSGEGYHTW